MKLLKLSSNNPKFKTLIFKNGLNIVAGLQLTKEDRETYNGVGKSFSLTLIHLLFGATLDKNKQKDKKILEFLAGYGVFCLEFTHKGEEYIIQKDFSEAHCFINKKKILQKDYSDELRKMFMRGLDPTVTFKQLINVFARRYGGTYYSNIVTQQGRPVTDYYQMYVNLRLLGIDTEMVQEKAIIKDKLNQLEKAKKVVEGYETLLEESNIKDVKDELNDLIKDKNEFNIAKNYDQLKHTADDLTVAINEQRNIIHSIEKNIIRKSESLKHSKSVSIDLDRVKRIYEEANFFFKEKVLVRLEDANEFHFKLMNSRVDRLEAEIDFLRQEEKQLNFSLICKEKHRDSILKDLDSKGALEEYNSINDRIRTLEEEVRELEKYKRILEGFKNDKVNLDLENASINAKSIQYLIESKEYLDSIEDRFRGLVKRFYKNSGGSFRVKETKDAKYLFNIDVHVPRDGAQGVDEVKIFCYDFLLYQLNPDFLNFIAHDGCIFSEMDPRQKSMIFKVALEFTNKNDLQYFINIGQSSLNEILDEKGEIKILTNEEKAEIRKSVILKLYDKNPSKWLMGTSFG